MFVLPSTSNNINNNATTAAQMMVAAAAAASFGVFPPSNSSFAALFGNINDYSSLVQQNILETDCGIVEDSLNERGFILIF